MIVADDFAPRYDHYHFAGGADVLERVGAEGDEVCESAGGDDSELDLHIEDRCGVEGG